MTKKRLAPQRDDVSGSEDDQAMSLIQRFPAPGILRAVPKNMINDPAILELRATMRTRKMLDSCAPSMDTDQAP